MNKIVSTDFITDDVQRLVPVDATATTPKNAAVAKLMKAWEAKTTQRTAKGAGLTLMALSLAACNDDNTTTAATPTTPTTPVTPAGQTFTLTTGVDAVTGGAGDDSFVGQMDATATLNTLGLLDVVDGGAGTDTLTVINTTANAVSTALTAASVTNIENFVYMATAGGALDFDDAGSATNFSMTVLGASNFTDVRTTDTVTIVNGGAAMDSTYTYNATNVTGTADAHTIAFTSVTAGADLELSGAVETITLDVNGASAFADLVLDAATTAVNIDAGAALTVATTLTATGVVTYTVTGAGAVTLTPALGTATTAYNAAASTGAQTILAGVSNITITGGSAADVIDMGVTLTSNDTIDGGAGADTLRVDLTSLTAGTADHSISNVETLRLDNVTTSGALNMDNLSFSTVRFDSGAAATETITLTDVATSIIAFSFLGAGTANADLLFDEVVIDYDTTTTQAAASFLVNNGGVDADDITIGKIDIDRIEALTVTATDIGTAAADELTIAEIEGDHMTDLVVIADGEVIITDVDLLIGDTFDFTAADGGVAVSISDAATALTITMGDGNDVVTMTKNEAAETVTVDLGAGNDTYVSTDEADTITTGTGSDTVTFQGDEADDANVITDFTVGAGGDVIDFVTNDTSGLGTATLTSFGSFATVAAFATATAAVTGDENNLGFVTLGANVTAGTEAALVTTIGGANVFADIVTTTGAGAVTDQMYIAADNGVDTFIFHVINGGTATGDIGTIVATDTVTLIATLEGVSDATTLTAANLADFI